MPTALPTDSHQPGDPGLRELPVFYYLDNFRGVITRVFRDYDDLLNAREQAYYHALQQLLRPSLALYVRMLSRRGQMFRTTKLNYAEIPDVTQALQSLAASGLVTLHNSAPLEDVLPLFTKSEWYEWLTTQGRATAKNIKLCDLYDHIRQYAAENSQTHWKFDETLVSLCESERFDTFKLLYFGNGRQDLTDFVLRDLGIFRYESYRLDKTTRLFENRAQIDVMLQIYQLRETLDNIATFSPEQLVNLHKNLPAVPKANASVAERSIRRRLQRLQITLARQMERLGADAEALAIYQTCDQPPSRERQARILHRQGENQTAFNLCDTLLAEGSEAEIEFAQHFIGKLAKRLNIAAVKKARFTAQSETLRLNYDESLSVEQTAADFYSDIGPCWHLENHLLLGVFGLVFWPVFFAEVRGAFSHEFQFAPHELYQEDFLQQRQTVLEQGWRRLESWHSQPQACCEFFLTKQGITNPFVHWAALDTAIITLALTRIPLVHWQSIFQRLWQNLRENRNGFPDLVHFPNKGGYALLEIKGPGDRLQKNQNRWLAYFEEHSIPYRVVYVRWQ